jgi:hypothetical protein
LGSREKNVEFFATTNKEKINVVNQGTTRQKIGTKLKKFINGVVQRHLKKGDGYVVTLSNSTIEQKSDETSIPNFKSFCEGKGLDRLHVINLPLEELARKDGILF